MKFTGHERDYAGSFGREDGHAIDYMHARYYNTGMGRFLAVDPVEGFRRQPQSWNRYSYVYDNPIRYRDPDGLVTTAWDNLPDWCKINCQKVTGWHGGANPTIYASDSITVTAKDPKKQGGGGRSWDDRADRIARAINRRSASVPGWVIAMFGKQVRLYGDDVHVFQNDRWVNFWGAEAITYGNVIIADSKGLRSKQTMDHELKHVKQSEVQGVLFYPDYATQYLFNRLALGDQDAGYQTVRQEIEANH